MEPEFPVEFVVPGVPVSAQAARRRSREDWKTRVQLASLTALPEGHWWSEGRISVTLFYFPSGTMQGDVDNIVKLTLDAMCRHLFRDDRQVERLVVQKFEPDKIFTFSAPTPVLAAALDAPKPILYVRLSDNPFEDLE